MKHLAKLFNKPAMSFDKIILLGICEVILIIVKEANGRFYGITNAIYHALSTAIILALFIQLFRLIAEVKSEK